MNDEDADLWGVATAAVLEVADDAEDGDDLMKLCVTAIGRVAPGLTDEAEARALTFIERIAKAWQGSAPTMREAIGFAAVPDTVRQPMRVAEILWAGEMADTCEHRPRPEDGHPVWTVAWRESTTVVCDRETCRGLILRNAPTWCYGCGVDRPDNPSSATVVQFGLLRYVTPLCAACIIEGDSV
ncbi:hypothetical protein [uncultured Jatrophihabitans sp.]|uniref:hypothetical protein n=1 Tax=uncultured Jatrophihabitans sp. TaxID=1610747 RepID=UPI0035CB7261